ncbi:heme o synthase [Litoreibacter arenae]|uniref:Protoheme IX farnesyltransferase n=1 Tax=Litoreibacter arenae DSM 19593 TaxID=1123360 RepID=S9RGG0_9RHOB|nr:heme o synthase [Litoreibacter arenae]EPX77165.1 Heme O synthase, protoheme IX farnesyltransferase COX10-CtaB [Litoreibacter arenae DSM 19593]
MQAALNMTISILKLRIGSFVALAALVGILASGGSMRWGAAAAFTLAVLGASGAAGAFNQYYERESDRLMARTRTRPFASGTLKAGPIWPVTFSALLAVSIVLAWATGGTPAAVLVFAGAVTYGLIYTLLLKKRTVWNVVIGGAAGSFALLAGAVAAAPDFGPVLGPAPVLLAVVLFLWTPPHFWALAAVRGEDYRRAGIPMLPVTHPPVVWTTAIFGHVLVLSVLSLAPLLYGFGPIYGIFAVIGAVIFLRPSWRLLRDPVRGNAMATFKASLLHFALLSLGVILDRGVAAWGG